MDQSIRADIKIATSTPNDHIKTLSERYGIPVFVNKNPSGIAGDWNYALTLADTPVVLIAHQDDIYEKGYAEAVLREAGSAEDPIMVFTDYAELRGTDKVTSNKILKVKKFLLLPLKIKAFRRSKWIRRRVLSMGNPVCCPSVSYVRSKLPPELFDSSLKVSLDWAAWECLSRLKGSFVYIPEVLMCHRIHGESETTRQIENSGRTTEDYLMFRKFWPAPIARLLEHFYRSSESSNKI